MFLPHGLCCPRGLAYVRKTSRIVKKHENKSAIHSNDQDYPVAVNFNNEKHYISALCFCGIEKVSPPTIMTCF